MKATLTHKRRHPGGSGAYIVTVTCPDCGKARTVAWAGWSAIICGGCGAELKRGTYRKARR
ncbi:hypothetical protein CMI37_38345 [Candidatus Pacearchaeota archaeon]|nr:hypothetical protein [Candidatus Pacearchaeota archaeon]